MGRIHVTNYRIHNVVDSTQNPARVVANIRRDTLGEMGVFSIETVLT